MRNFVICFSETQQLLDKVAILIEEHLRNFKTPNELLWFCGDICVQNKFRFQNNLFDHPLCAISMSIVILIDMSGMKMPSRKSYIVHENHQLTIT